MHIVVIIPAYNESRTIGSLVTALKAKDLDVVVLNDGSDDGTGDLAREAGAEVIDHPAKMGKGRTLRDGFAYALERAYDGVITMDGDGQHAVNDIDAFVTQASAHRGDVITGNRMANASKMPRVRFLTNKFMSNLISLACHQVIPDTQCGYRYISCDLLRQMNLSSGDFEIETEILMKACKLGSRVYSVPVETIYRDEKSKINPLKDTLRFFTYFLKELFSGKGR